MPFTTSILVRFGDLDPAGIAYYPNLVNFLHEAFEDFCTGHVGRPYPELYREGLGFPTARLEVEFLAPVQYGDQVVMVVRAEHVGRSAVHMRYEASVAGRPVFRALNVQVAVDLKTFRPLTLPDWLRARFEAALDPSAAPWASVTRSA